MITNIDVLLMGVMSVVLLSCDKASDVIILTYRAMSMMLERYSLVDRFFALVLNYLKMGKYTDILRVLWQTMKSTSTPLRISIISGPHISVTHGLCYTLSNSICHKLAIASAYSLGHR